MKTLKSIGAWLIVIGVLFNIAETAYFGWNDVAMSPAEEIADLISKYIIIGGWFLMLIPMVTVLDWKFEKALEDYLEHKQFQKIIKKKKKEQEEWLKKQRNPH